MPIPPHRKEEVDFIYLTQGSSIRSHGLVNYDILPHYMFFLPSGQISQHVYLASDSTGYYGYFHLDLFQKLFQNRGVLDHFSFLKKHQNPLVYIPSEDQSRIETILEQLLRTYEEKHPEKGRLWATFLFALLLEIAPFEPLTPQRKINATRRIALDYAHLLESRIYDWRKVSDFADFLQISTDHLNKCAKAVLGKTSQDLLGEMIILEAKVLLQQTNAPIQEIALQMADSNPSDFARFFKMRTNMSPKDYRKCMTDL